MNYEVLAGGLQRLSKASPPTGDMAGGEGAPLNEFKTEYPVLFECLEAVFGTMMSNSRLCEQIHGMMRHGLRSSIGMDQADHQRMYDTGTNYLMKEERRNMMSTDANAFRKKHKKARQHSKTKGQQQRMSRQLIEQSATFVKVAESVMVMELDSIHNIIQVSKGGKI